jgi:hypothetical protein
MQFDISGHESFGRRIMAGQLAVFGKMRRWALLAGATTLILGASSPVVLACEPTVLAHTGVHGVAYALAGVHVSGVSRHFSGGGIGPALANGHISVAGLHPGFSPGLVNRGGSHARGLRLRAGGSTKI